MNTKALASPLEDIDLVIFDKDGTLIDFHAMWGGWVRDLVDRLERGLGDESGDLAATVFDLFGVDPETDRVLPHALLAATPMARLRELLEHVVAEQVGSAERAAAALDAAWRAPDPVGLARPIGDLRGLLESIRDSGRRIAIATADDRDPTTRTLVALGLTPLVEALACADDPGPTKPAPDPVHRLCAALGVVPARAVVVGDSVADLAMGRAAGVRRVIGVLTGAADRATLEPLADLVLDSVQELLPA